MNLPFTLPDWLPDWAFLLLAIPALLFALAFLLMPFSVFGLKARLEAVEAQLDTVVEELRNLNLRSRGAAGPGFADSAGPGFADSSDGFDPLPNFSRLKAAARDDSRIAAPMPPPAATPQPPPRQVRRTEPRLD